MAVHINVYKSIGRLYSRLDKVVKQLYADCGENQHFNEYGHRLLGHFLYRLFTVRSIIYGYICLYLCNIYIYTYIYIYVCVCVLCV